MKDFYDTVKTTTVSTVLLCAMVTGSCGVLAGSEDNPAIFGPVKEADYLRGRFIPEKHPLFVKVGDYGIPCDRPHYLRKEAAEALKKMYGAMKKDLPGVRFWIQSSTRNWNAQKAIWEKRWKGISSANKKAGEEEIAAKILQSSSMPGTSRHHWGTDFDTNILKNDYYEKGDGAKLYEWLKKNAGDYGFCKPYSAGRSAGYMEERWHWSYMPLAVDFQDRWNVLFMNNPEDIIKDSPFKGGESAVKVASVYVNAIDNSCRDTGSLR